VYNAPIWDVVELRQRLVKTWTEFQQIIMDEPNEQWCCVTDSAVVFAQRKVTLNTYSIVIMNSLAAAAL